MKKRYYIIIIVLLLLCIVVCVVYFNDKPSSQSPRVSTIKVEGGVIIESDYSHIVAKEHNIIVRGFNLSDPLYQYGIENYPVNINVGPVTNAKTAIVHFKNLVNEYFGTVNQSGLYGITDIWVRYDKNNSCWCIYGQYNDESTGTIPIVLIKKTGEVLSVFRSY